MRHVVLLSLLLLFGGTTVGAQMSAGSSPLLPLDNSGNASSAPLVLSYEPAPPEPPHLDFTPVRSSLGFDLAPMAAWYGDMPLAGIAWHGIDNADASGVGYAAGISGMQWLRDGVGVRAAIRYVGFFSNASLARTVPLQLRTGPGSADTTERDIPTPISIESSTDLHLLQTSVALVQRFAEIAGGELSLTIGPTASLVVAARQFESVELDSSVTGVFLNPEGMPSENNGRKLILLDGDSNEHPTVRAGIMAGLQFEFRVAYDIALVQSIEYDFSLLQRPESQRAGRMNSLSARAAMLWYFW